MNTIRFKIIVLDIKKQKNVMHSKRFVCINLIHSLREY